MSRLRYLSTQRGFTLVESAVAMTILVAGITIFLWQMRQQSSMAQAHMRKLTALEAAQSDLESLQAMPAEWVHDTTFTLAGPGEEKLQVIRVVYDTADFENSREMLKLGPDLLPLALKEPREVQVRVYRLDALSSEPEHDSEPLIRLTARLPQYQP